MPSPDRLGSRPKGGAGNLTPRGGSVCRRKGGGAGGAGETQQIRGPGEQGSVLLDTEHDLVAYGNAEGIAHGLGNGDLTLRGHSRRHIHRDSFLTECTM